MKTIKIAKLETTIPFFRNKYEPKLFNSLHLFPEYKFEIINDPINNYCDICLYDLYSIKYEEASYIFDSLKYKPIFILDTHIEHPSFPQLNNTEDTFKIWTNNYTNYSISMYEDSKTNLYYPILINFEMIYNCINIRQKFDLKKKNKFANWISSNPSFLRKNKIDYINENYKHIDYYGNICYGNSNIKGIELSREWFSPSNIQTNYKFNFAFENTSTKNNIKYITEKINHAYIGNSIPIYWGSSNIIDLFNENSFINVCDLTIDEMINKIKNIDENDKLYKDMFYEYPFKDKNINYHLYFQEKYINFMRNIFNIV